MFLVIHAVRQCLPVKRKKSFMQKKKKKKCLGILEEVSNVDSKQQPMTAIVELHEIVFSTSHILQQQCSTVPVLNQSSFTLYAIPDHGKSIEPFQLNSMGCRLCT